MSDNQDVEFRVCGYLALFVSVMSIANISIGAVYLNDCPRQPYIPIYLIVLGVFSLVFTCFPTAQKHDDSPDNRNFIICTSVILLFLSCFVMIGSIWIYSIYEPNYNKNTTNVDPYCDKTVYLFAFWTTTLNNILIGFFMLIGYCCKCCLFGFSI